MSEQPNKRPSFTDLFAHRDESHGSISQEAAPYPGELNIIGSTTAFVPSQTQQAETDTGHEAFVDPKALPPQADSLDLHDHQSGMTWVGPRIDEAFIPPTAQEEDSPDEDRPDNDQDDDHQADEGGAQ